MEIGALLAVVSFVGAVVIARALLGVSRTEWIAYLLPWLGMVAGATADAFAYPALNLAALWPAAVIAAMFAVVTLLVPTRWSAGSAQPLVM